jgi:hypothetical protein
MEQLQFADLRVAGLEHAHPGFEAALLEFAHERAVAIGAERMAVAESVAGQPFTEHDSNLRAFGVQRFTVSLRFGQQDLRQR